MGICLPKSLRPGGVHENDMPLQNTKQKKQSCNKLSKESSMKGQKIIQNFTKNQQSTREQKTDAKESDRQDENEELNFREINEVEGQENMSFEGGGEGGQGHIKKYDEVGIDLAKVVTEQDEQEKKISQNLKEEDAQINRDQLSDGKKAQKTYLLSGPNYDQGIMPFDQSNPDNFKLDIDTIQFPGHSLINNSDQNASKSKNNGIICVTPQKFAELRNHKGLHQFDKWHCDESDEERKNDLKEDDKIDQEIPYKLKRSQTQQNNKAQLLNTGKVVPSIKLIQKQNTIVVSDLYQEKNEYEMDGKETKQIVGSFDYNENELLVAQE